MGPKLTHSLIRVAALALAAAVLACADSSSVLVDRMGVSDAKYDQDFAECKKSSPFSLSFSNPVASCMSAKGYKVLMGR